MNERVLVSPPGLRGLFTRAGTGALPLISRVPGVGARRAEHLPETVLRLESLEVDRDRLARYSRLCGFPLRDSLPVTFPHILAFSLQLSLMTEPTFPFPAIGLVHIENEITQHRSVRADESLSLRVWTEDLRPHPRGRQFSIRTELRSDSELVWEETSVNLRRGGGSSHEGGVRQEGGSRHGEGSPDGAGDSPPAEPAPASETAIWRLDGDLGRRYGAIAGDLNPIHLHPLTARLFGFSRPIAHGMWTKARCLAALDATLGERIVVRARFRRPIPLPGKVAFAVSERTPGGPTGFAVRSASGDAVHLTGTVDPL